MRTLFYGLRLRCRDMTNIKWVSHSERNVRACQNRQFYNSRYCRCTAAAVVVVIIPPSLLISYYQVISSCLFVFFSFTPQTNKFSLSSLLSRYHYFHISWTTTFSSTVPADSFIHSRTEHTYTAYTVHRQTVSSVVIVDEK